MTATSNSVMDFNVFMKLTESEARALDALVGYGHKEFLNVFYEKLGKAYMEQHEKGLISLFQSVRMKYHRIFQGLIRQEKFLKTIIQKQKDEPHRRGKSNG